jgi:hypothetical protein
MKQEGEHAMRKFLAVIGVLLMVAVLTAAPVAWAADVQAKVQSLDKSGKWLTLDTGLKLMIPTNVQVDKQALQPGTDVKVSYETQGSEHIVTAIQLQPATK